jgi:putative transposase
VKYDGMTVLMAAWLRTLEDENRWLKMLLAESMLDVSALRDLLGKLTRSVERYAVVEKLMADYGSKRRACRLIGVNRSKWQYDSLCVDDDAVREPTREIANVRRRLQPIISIDRSRTVAS